MSKLPSARPEIRRVLLTGALGNIGRRVIQGLGADFELVPTDIRCSEEGPEILVADLVATPGPGPTAVFPQLLLGKILFLGDIDGEGKGGTEAFMMNPDGSGLARLTSMEFYNRANEREAYSADQRFRAMSRKDRENGTAGLNQIFYNDYFYSSLTQLTKFGAGTAWDPVWSPTSETVAFVSNESNNDEIFVIKKGEWPAQQLTRNDYEWDHHPSWTPDGTQILFSSNRISGQRQLWIMEADGGNQRQFSNFPFEVWNPIWVKYADR